MPAAQVGDLRTGLVLSDDPDDRALAETALPHVDLSTERFSYQLDGIQGSRSKAFNFIGSSLASAAAPAGGIQFNNGSGTLAGDTALVWDNASKALGIGTAAPSIKAVLDLTSTTKGFLPPRMTTAQRDAIASPATGLQVYNTTTNALNVFNGTSWGAVGGGGSIATASDVTLASPANGHVLTYNGTQWVNAAAGAAMNTTSMVANWPDAIVCDTTSPNVSTDVFYLSYAPSSAGTYVYRANLETGAYYGIIFTSAGAFSSTENGVATTNCNASISSLYAAGRAFNFIGSSLASAAAPAGGIQFNNGSGVLAGDTALVWDNTNKRLGIGTTVPVTALHVFNSGSEAARFVRDLAIDTGLSIQSDNTGPLLDTIGAHTFRIFTNASERVRIDSTGNVGIGTALPSAKAILDLSSTTKGFLPPRMTTAQRDAIAAPSTGLIVYNTTNIALEMFNGASWTSVGSALPNGAIAAFASATCPSGWSEFTPARGRFLRGIDNGVGLD
ncbi:MAG: hypothetical protein ABL908_05070, partial [Hyphomicrobium sp.]